MALYDDIGGAPAVRAALDAFYPRVLADAKLSPFFQGVDIDRLKRTRRGSLRWLSVAPTPIPDEASLTLTQGRGKRE